MPPLSFTTGALVLLAPPTYSYVFLHTQLQALNLAVTLYAV